MRTTIDIKDATLAELRSIARRRGESLRATVERSLEMGLSQMTRAPQRRKVRIRPHPLGMKPAYHGISLNQLYDRLESESHSS
jgi:hypothetical protein